MFVLKYPSYLIFCNYNLLHDTVLLPFLLDNINIYFLSESGSDFVFLIFVLLHVMNL